MKTLDQLKAEETSDIAAKKVPRINKEPMEEQLKKIAANSAHPGEAKWKRSMDHVKQKRLAADYRYPEKINMHTMAKEAEQLRRRSYKLRKARK